MQRRLILTCITLTTSLVACSGDEPTGPGKVSARSGLTTEASQASGNAKRITRGGQVSDVGIESNGGESEPKLLSPSGPSAEDAAFAKLMAECGFASGKFPEPTQVLFQKSMRSQPITITGSKPIPTSNLPFGNSFLVGALAGKLPPANYKAVVRTTANVSATLAGAKQSVRANLESFNVTVPGLPVSIPPDTGRADAQQEVQANNSDSTAAGPDDQTRGDMIGGDGPWQGIYCTVMPTQSLTVSKGGYTKTIKFDPPLPGGIWMKASPKRFKEEVGEGKTFGAITATVSNSNDPSLPNGTKLTGSATIKPVSGQLGELSLNADIAYEIRTAFGGRTADLGLSPVQTFYVTSNTQDLRAIVIETGVSTMPRLVMSPAQ